MSEPMDESQRPADERGVESERRRAAMHRRIQASRWRHRDSWIPPAPGSGPGRAWLSEGARRG